MKTMTVNDAMVEALAEEMRRDARVITFGEGVATKGYELKAEFGERRVRNTPLSEGIIAGTAAGAAATGLRPVIDLLFAPFLTFSMDELVTITRTGAGWGVGAQHNHNVEAWFVHAPGLKVVMPSTPADFKGLLKSAIRDDNPVMFFADIGLLFQPGEVPEGDDHLVPLGKAAIRREGSDLTLISYAKTVQTCLTAAEALAEQGIAAEVLDLPITRTRMALGNAPNEAMRGRGARPRPAGPPPASSG